MTLLAGDDRGGSDRFDGGDIAARASARDAIERGAGIARIQASANALRAFFCVRFGQAGIGAAVDDRRSVHGVLDRFPKLIVVIVRDAWVLANHFLDRHLTPPSVK